MDEVRKKSNYEKKITFENISFTIPKEYSTSQNKVGNYEVLTIQPADSTNNIVVQIGNANTNMDIMKLTTQEFLEI